MDIVVNNAGSVRDSPFEQMTEDRLSPLVAYLAHPDCAVSAEIFTVGAGQVARFFIGRTRGYYQPDLSVEDVAAHLTEIYDPTGHTIPAGPADEMAELFKTSF